MLNMFSNEICHSNVLLCCTFFTFSQTSQKKALLFRIFYFSETKFEIVFVLVLLITVPAF